jgi:transcription-repair coupling factor (superfamily II helicase)
VAALDLEIRGAGNLLGAEQSGHIAEVGFDLYLRLVGEAVAAFRGEEIEEDIPMRIELPVEAHLPTDYIDSERLRLGMYQRIADVRDEAGIEALISEMTDRYGTVPAPALRLLDVARLKNLCRGLGLREVVAQGDFVRLSPVGAKGAPLPESKQLRLMRLYPKSVIKESMVLVRRVDTGGMFAKNRQESDILQWVNDLVLALFE